MVTCLCHPASDSNRWVIDNFEVTLRDFSLLAGGTMRPGQNAQVTVEVPGTELTGNFLIVLTEFTTGTQVDIGVEYEVLCEM